MSEADLSRLFRSLIIRVAVVSLAHTHIFVNDGGLAIIPLFREKGDIFDICNRIGDMRNTLGKINAVPRADINKFFFPIIGFGHHYAITFGE